MDERERRLLEKRYQLPDNPHLIIHPSRTAKSGKFFCNVMSLSILLDYRPEDTKEHSFEVSLFAELFNEMLMRDFGFNIYKALHALPEKSKEALEEEDSKDRRRNDDEPKEKKSRKDDESKETKEDSAIDDKDKSNDSSEGKKKDSRDKDRKRRRADDDIDDDNSVKSSDKRKDKERPKYVTIDPDLLLSFVYFDQTHCGYIFEKDIEELFYTLGLNLSRAQTRKLVGKVVSRDSLFYRKLTDKPKDENDATIEKTTDTELTVSQLDEISKGNKAFLPVFKKDSGIATIGNEKERNQNFDSSKENGKVVETNTGNFLVCHF